MRTFCETVPMDFYAQLMRDGNVAVTGMSREYQMIRLSGKAHRLDDQKLWIDRIFAENPSMNSVYSDDSRYVLEPFYIDNGAVDLAWRYTEESRQITQP